MTIIAQILFSLKNVLEMTRECLERFTWEYRGLLYSYEYHKMTPEERKKLHEENIKREKDVSKRL